MVCFNITPSSFSLLLATASGLNELASILSLEHSHSSLTEAPFSHLAVVWQQTGVVSNQ